MGRKEPPPLLSGDRRSSGALRQHPFFSRAGKGPIHGDSRAWYTTRGNGARVRRLLPSMLFEEQSPWVVLRSQAGPPAWGDPYGVKELKLLLHFVTPPVRGPPASFAAAGQKI